MRIIVNVDGLIAEELMYHGKGTGRFKYLDSNGEVVARQCKTCMEVKSIDDYSFSMARGKRKYHGECKPCNSKSSLTWNKNNPDRFNKNQVKFVEKLKTRTPADLKAVWDKKFPDGVKNCSMCKELVDISEFYVDIQLPSGLSSRCIPCNSDHHRQWLTSNPERAKELNFIARERFKARSEEELIADMWRVHPDGLKMCKVCHELKDFSCFAVNRSRYDALLARCRPCQSAHGVMRRRQRRPKYWMSRGIPIECYMCGEDFEEVEHVIPLALGGPDIDENTLPSCVVCNRMKSDTPLEEFVVWFSDPQSILDRVVKYGVEYRV